MRRIFISRSRRAAFLCLALSLLNLHSSSVLAADAKTSVPHAGDLTMAGAVHVDDAPAIPGQTIFTGSIFRVAAASRATLTLGNHTRLELSAETVLKLDFTESEAACALRAGRVRIMAPAGITARLMTKDAALRSDSGQPAIFSVESGSDGRTIIFVETGEVEMSVGDRAQSVSAGQTLSILGASATLTNGRQHLGAVKRNVLEFGLVGVLSVVTLLLAGNGGGEPDELTFGGTVCVLSPGAPCGLR
ncbi:MAG TPA: hypothetical protein VF708_07430 [Pyrinomonadaceae bacterium]|jgi:ferric-dicitrate binding protein FerR (iron transport regulator)